MKKWYLSKTLWTNIVAAAAVILQGLTGKELFDAATQAVLISAINVALRLATRTEVVW
ncbi:MAG TPA: hypothetical protein VGK71_08450 [Nitrospirota bacterium]|jgi:hypothetical protein